MTAGHHWLGSRRQVRRRAGFTLIELLLVTVVLGIIANIVAPYFQRAREQALVALVQADVRQMLEGVESYIALNDGAWPSSLEEVEAGGSYVPSDGVEYCAFVSVPRASGREPYVVALAAHRGTSWKVFVAYPIWGSRMIEYDSGGRGC